jgi:hypothetical protein
MNYIQQFLSESINKMYLGNILLLFCFLFYLAWWRITFNPYKVNRSGRPAYLFAAFILGIAAIFFILSSIASLAFESSALPVRYFILFGILAFMVLLPVTSRILKRLVTSELLIMHFWTVLELSMAEVLSGTGYLIFLYKQILVIMIAVASVISLICYLIYYRLDANLRFRVGMIPLGIACFMAVAFLAGLGLSNL